MAIIYTYPQKASVDATDTFLITDGSDNQTKTVSASAIAEYVDDEVTLQEVLDAGNSAVQSMNLKGLIRGDEGRFGPLQIDGDVTMNGSKIRKTSGDLNIFTEAGDLNLTGDQNVEIRSDNQDIVINAQNDISLDGVEVDITASSSKITADALVLGRNNPASLVRITGGAGGSGYFPNSSTDEFSINGVLALYQQVKDSVGATGITGQALLVNGVNKTTWSTLYSQKITTNKILVGNASDIPTETDLIDVDLATDNVMIGNASSLVTVKGKLQIPESSSPITGTSGGKKGEISFDTFYMYICIAQDTWKRIPLQDIIGP
mgnify:CR=1 FL=1|tara:strand:- start:55 stop:1011 length:957 start_codon:yes stop_codon:yes gene_type:complete